MLPAILPVIKYLGAGKILYAWALAVEERLNIYLDSLIQKIQESEHTKERKDYWIARIQGIKELIPKKETFKESTSYIKYEADELVIKRIKHLLSETHNLISEYANEIWSSAEKMLEDFNKNLLENEYISKTMWFIKDLFEEIISADSTKNTTKKEDE